MESLTKLSPRINYLEYLDVNIQYACNLACVGCISLSNFDRRGGVRITEGKQWLEDWSKKLSIGTLCLFGGEPLLNPDFDDWVVAVRNFFPNTHIKVITNGFYLKQSHVNILSKVKNATLQISFHFKNRDKKLLTIIKNAIGHIDFTITKSDKAEVFLKFTNKSINIQCARFGEFRKPYKNDKTDMLPWNSTDLQASIDHCGSPKNPILYNNRLYKCAPIANLKDTLESLDYYDNTAWQPYLNYKGYGLADDIQPFIKDFGRPNKICSMCCSTKDSEVDHFAEGMVRKKKK